MSRNSGRMMMMSDRREFEGEMVWSLIKTAFWIWVGYRIGVSQ
jgi:hypothetical protein